jgi:hypothetical protein
MKGKPEQSTFPSGQDSISDVKENHPVVVPGANTLMTPGLDDEQPVAAVASMSDVHRARQP